MEIDTRLVRRLVTRQFPHWAHLAITPVEPGGWDNRTFRLGENMLVRLPSAERYAAQVEKEQRWLPRLAPDLPLPVPAPIAMGAPVDDYLWPWSIYRWVDGEPATIDRIVDLVRFARSLGEFLNALYRIEAKGGPAAGPHNFHRGGAIAVYDEETRAALDNLTDGSDRHAAEEVWKAGLASAWERPSVWVHGDIAVANLLVRNGELCGVVDFGSSAVGDPACDLVIAWTLFHGASREAFRESFAFDEETWARARGWALWKALITISGNDSSHRDVDASWRTIREVLADYRGACHS